MDKAPKIPETGCDDCSQLEERVEALEECCDEVHETLDSKADKDTVEEDLQALQGQINALTNSWHYAGDVATSADLPDTFMEGEVYYCAGDNGFYVAMVDRPDGGGTISDFVFISSSAGGASITQMQVTLLDSDWDAYNQQSVTVTGMTATKPVVVSPDYSSYDEYAESGVKCMAQSTDSLDFECDTIPNASLTVNLLIFN